MGIKSGNPVFYRRREEKVVKPIRPTNLYNVSRFLSPCAHLPSRNTKKTCRAGTRRRFTRVEFSNGNERFLCCRGTVGATATARSFHRCRATSTAVYRRFNEPYFEITARRVTARAIRETNCLFVTVKFTLSFAPCLSLYLYQPTVSCCSQN